MDREVSEVPARSRFRVRHVLAGVLLLAVLGVLMREWVLRRNEPRYLGRTEREWFPLWSNGVFPVGPLRTAPPEALPMLIAALHRPDSRLLDWWNAVVEKAPNLRGVDLHLTAPGQVRYGAIQAVVQSAAGADFARALMERFDGLTEEDQLGILHELGNRPTPRDSIRHLSPILIRCFEKRDRAHAWMAGLAMLNEPGLARQHTGPLVSMVAEEMTLKRGVPWRIPMFLKRLGDLGRVELAEVQPLVQAVRVDVNRTELARQNRARGLITLSRLAPEAFPPRSYLDGAMNAEERKERVAALEEILSALLRQPKPPTDLAAWLELFLRMDDYAGQAPTSSDRLAYRDRVLGILNELPRGAPLTPAIQSAMMAGLDNSLPAVRRAAAAAMVQIKQPAPMVVERSAAVLLEGVEPDFMLRVLGNARVIPDSVQGLVRDLAAGSVPANWTPRPTLSDESARRLNLTPVRESLSTLAKELLRKVEESSGSGVQR